MANHKLQEEEWTCYLLLNHFYAVLFLLGSPVLIPRPVGGRSRRAKLPPVPPEQSPSAPLRITAIVNSMSTGISTFLCVIVIWHENYPFMNSHFIKGSQFFIKAFSQEHKSLQSVIRAHVHQRAHEGIQKSDEDYYTYSEMLGSL
ncbi:hypothetical protein HYPSUDRAFT_367128 [Hypholoma sublateritium FD-334 SS-4]|uniref:Uncharacterized protein n=1 Tax=Hypholoma sublateritium (strain FD-334 SS-4) TaxID=945553 RepID=A0A0D2LX30_HYPSF|nr:hypothetical protein HYPSUDRAFT_367128 [Hypholoma sublateritium FD-334 SS-4]